MYVNVFIASASSYHEKNFATLSEVKAFLNVTELPDFNENPFGGLSANIDGWNISIFDGDMPTAGDGYVDMRSESGALDWLREQNAYEYEHEDEPSYELDADIFLI